MNCGICNTPIPREKNSTICSDKCHSVHKKIFEIEDRYFPTHGCDNCWGDLYQGCSEQCRREFRDALKFGKDLFSIIRLIYPKGE